MNDEQVANYNGLKREILNRYGYSLTHLAQLFYDWRFVPNASPSPDERPTARHQDMAPNRCIHPLHPLQSGPGSLLTGATQGHVEGCEAMCSPDLGGPPGSSGDASEHSGPAEWELGRVGDPFEGTEGQPHLCVPRTDSWQGQRTANSWRDCWGRADPSPTTPGRWRPKEVF